MSCFYPQSDSSLGLFKKFSSFPYFTRKIRSARTQHCGKQNKEGTWPLSVQAPFCREKQTQKKRGNPLCSMPDAMELCRDHSRSTGQGAINLASEVGIAFLAELLKNLFSYGAMHRLRGFRTGDVGGAALPVTRGLVGSCFYTASSVRPHTASFPESLLTVWPGI